MGRPIGRLLPVANILRGSKKPADGRLRPDGPPHHARLFVAVLLLYPESMTMPKHILTVVMAVVLAVPAFARKPGEPIKPGFNLFSKQQDVQLGQQAAAEVRK